MQVFQPARGSVLVVPDALILTLAIVLVVVLVLGCCALVLASDARPARGPAPDDRRSGRPPRSRFLRRAAASGSPSPDATQRARRAAVVVNPTKFSDVDAVRRRITEGFTRRGWAEPLWLETTEEDPGRGQAAQALASGVELVCSLGGDGTVRNIASALTGSGVPLGLLPGGTGNLLARNLSLPVNELDGALEVAIGGRNKRIDTVRLVIERPSRAQLEQRGNDPQDPGDPNLAPTLSDAHDVPEPGSSPVTEEHVYLVMAGLGFDAELMAGASERLKSTAGWLAYVVSGAQHLKGPQYRVEIASEAAPTVHRRVRTVLVGNVGRLTGGMVLLPDAKADDGVLDTIVLSPKGLVGWAAVAARIATQRRHGHDRVAHLQSATVSVRSDKPVEIQLDGDPMGQAIAMQAEVDPLSLLVRVPA